jgi:hypothetical protein
MRVAGVKFIPNGNEEELSLSISNSGTVYPSAKTGSGFPVEVSKSLGAG